MQHAIASTRDIENPAPFHIGQYYSMPGRKDVRSGFGFWGRGGNKTCFLTSSLTSVTAEILGRCLSFGAESIQSVSCALRLSTKSNPSEERE